MPFTPDATHIFHQYVVAFLPTLGVDLFALVLVVCAAEEVDVFLVFWDLQTVFLLALDDSSVLEIDAPLNKRGRPHGCRRCREQKRQQDNTNCFGCYGVVFFGF